VSINDPLGRIEALEAEQKQLKEQVQRIEQATEPINVRIERGLPVPEAQLLQTLVTMAGTNATEMALLKGELGVLKGEMGVLKGDVAELRIDMQKRFDAIADVQNLILHRLQEKDK
jgi:predicted  nucleic acid-binding Zn-ribbon protein